MCERGTTFIEKQEMSCEKSIGHDRIQFSMNCTPMKFVDVNVPCQTVPLRICQLIFL
jgi:hypothetical protein